MNRYGAMAQQHWRTWLPTRYSELSEPTIFFARLGDEVEARIARETTQLASRAPAQPETPDYLTAVGAWNAIRAGVEEQILREMVLLEPEPQTQDLDEIPRETPTGMPTDPDHPLWAMLEDDEVDQETFATALRSWRANLHGST